MPIQTAVHKSENISENASTFYLFIYCQLFYYYE